MFPRPLLFPRRLFRQTFSLSPPSPNLHGILDVPRPRANSVLFIVAEYALAVSYRKAWSTSPDQHSATTRACLSSATCRVRMLPFRTYSILAMPQTAATSIIRTLLRTLPVHYRARFLLNHFASHGRMTSVRALTNYSHCPRRKPARESPLILNERFWHILRGPPSITSSSSKIRSCLYVLHPT